MFFFFLNDPQYKTSRFKVNESGFNTVSLLCEDFIIDPVANTAEKFMDSTWLCYTTTCLYREKK